MNRYEIHQELEAAKKTGYSEGYEAGRLQGDSGRRFGFGKPVIEAEFMRMPNHDAYELRARLVIGDKWYAAKQHIDREAILRLVAEQRKNSDRLISQWLQGATEALLKEFARDIQYKMPELPK